MGILAGCTCHETGGGIPVNSFGIKTIRTVIFSKAPVAGFAKTRLIPALGSEGSAALAQQMLSKTISAAQNARLGPVELCVSPSRSHPVWETLRLPDSLEWSEQGEGDLGVRMGRVAERVIRAGETLLLIGSDCPELDAAYLRMAAESLTDHTACIGPVGDGGYVLFGLNAYESTLFSDIPWSTEEVASITLQRISEMKWSVKVLATLHDIDEPGDLQWLPENLQRST